MEVFEVGLLLLENVWFFISSKIQRHSRFNLFPKTSKNGRFDATKTQTKLRPFRIKRKSAKGVHLSKKIVTCDLKKPNLQRVQMQQPKRPHCIFRLQAYVSMAPHLVTFGKHIVPTTVCKRINGWLASCNGKFFHCNVYVAFC